MRKPTGVSRPDRDPQPGGATAKPARTRGVKPPTGTAPVTGAAKPIPTAKSAATTTATGRAPARARGAAAAARAGWLGGIRFSGFTAIMLAIAVLAVVSLAPAVAELVQQRQRLAALEAQVAAQSAEVQKLRGERERWNDQTYIVTQARQRLYYVQPGEVSYLVIDDRAPTSNATAQTPISSKVTEGSGDWLRTLVGSVVTVGLTPAVGVKQ